MTEPGTCQTGIWPDLWSSDVQEDRAIAAYLCRECPILDACHEYAGKHRWSPTVVVAGWETPRSRSWTQRYPPWHQEKGAS